MFRNSEVTDAAFILSFKLDNYKSKYLNQTSPDFNQQVLWLSDYIAKTDQAYFIFETSEYVPVDTVRFYDAQADSFYTGEVGY